MVCLSEKSCSHSGSGRFCRRISFEKLHFEQRRPSPPRPHCAPDVCWFQYYFFKSLKSHRRAHPVLCRRLSLISFLLSFKNFFSTSECRPWCRTPMVMSTDVHIDLFSFDILLLNQTRPCLKKLNKIKITSSFCGDRNLYDFFFYAA